MSDRGSFCTDHIHCRECRLHVMEALNEIAQPFWHFNGVICGPTRSWPGGEHVLFEEEFSPSACHEFSIAVNSETGGWKVFEYSPD